MKDIDFTKDSRVVLLVGKRGTGKTSAVKYLILKNTVDRKIFSFGLVFSGSAFNNINFDYLPEEAVIEGYDEDILRNYVNALKQRVNDGKKFKAFLVFDDLMGIIRRQDPFIINLFIISRQINLSIFICVQHLKGSSSNTSLREITTDGIFFKSLRFDTQKAIWEEFSTQFEKFVQFKNHFLKVTKEKYNALYYNADADEVEDNFWGIMYPDMSELKIKISFD